MKRLIFATCISLAVILTACSSSAAPETDIDKLKSLEASDISYFVWSRSTPDGVKGNSATDDEDIEDIYNKLCNISLAEETDQGDSSNSLMIQAKAKDERLYFTFEGDVAVLENGKYYKAKNTESLMNCIDSINTED